MIVLDASVLIALLALEDPHHAAARSVLVADDTFAAHTVTLAEALVKAARVGRSREVAARFVRAGVTEADRLPDEAERLAQVRVDTGMKVPDCCVMVLAEELRSPLATFDQQLAVAAERRGIRVVGASR